MVMVYFEFEFTPYQLEELVKIVDQILGAA